MLILALATLPLLVLENYVRAVEVMAEPLNWAISGVFAADLAVRLVLHGPGRARFALSRWYDFVIVILTLIPVLMPLRALRSARLLKLLKAVRILAVGFRAYNSAKQTWGGLSGRFAIITAAILVAFSAATVWLFESNGEGEIDSYGQTVWWTFVTMTTVGYGDVSPVTSGGRVSAVVLMVAGITVFGIITANLAAHFSSAKDEPENEKQVEQLVERVGELTAAVERLTAQIEEGGARGPEGVGGS